MPERVKIHESLIRDISAVLAVLKTAEPIAELLANKPARFYSEYGRDESFSITYRLDDDREYYEVGI